jgi:hypothetical protein
MGIEYIQDLDELGTLLDLFQLAFSESWTFECFCLVPLKMRMIHATRLQSFLDLHFKYRYRNIE